MVALQDGNYQLCTYLLTQKNSRRYFLLARQKISVEKGGRGFFQRLPKKTKLMGIMDLPCEAKSRRVFVKISSFPKTFKTMPQNFLRAVTLLLFSSADKPPPPPPPFLRKDETGRSDFAENSNKKMAMI